MIEDRELLEKSIKFNIAKVDGLIAEAAAKASRKREEIILVAVSKYYPVHYAEIAATVGLKNFGENRVQELVPKIEYFANSDLTANWHMIGTLQKNKVKHLIGKVALIQSVNTLELAKEIDRLSEKNGVQSQILLQLNITEEIQKHGFVTKELPEVMKKIGDLEHIKVRGFMTMAEFTPDKSKVLNCFKQAENLYEKYKQSLKTEDFNLLSMGMSQDFSEAIACGSNMLRIGSAIFSTQS